MQTDRPIDPPVAVIILNWNGHKDTIECLDSFRKVEYRNYKVFVVDNGSTDNSMSHLRSSFPEIGLLRSEENLGFAGGNNFGINAVWNGGYEYFLLLNNDTIVDPAFLRNLVKAANECPDGGLFGPFVYDYNERDRISFRGGYFDGAKGPVFEVKDGLQSYPKDRPYGAELLSGCCMLIKKKVFEEVGFLDDRYFIYQEEADFCYRVVKGGWDSYMVPTSRIWHKVGSSAGDTMSRTMAYYITRNLLYFVAKNYDGFMKRLIFNGKFYSMLAVSTYRWLRGKKFELIKYSFAGIKDYYLGRMGKYRGDFQKGH